MKKVVLFLMGFCILVSSCVNSSEQLPVSSKESFLAHRELLTKAITGRLSEGVIRADVEAYLSCRMNISMEDVQDISQYYIAEDAYIFIVNLRNGRWFFISGDYSTKPLLAEGENGFYIDKGLSRHDQGWMESIRGYMLENRNSQSEEVKRNRQIWARAILAAETAKRANSPGERSGDDTMEVDIECITDTLYNDNYPALTSTTWWQSVPFNNAMPLLNNSGERCLAGCAVIAIAQLLYYTHFEFGYPNDIYANADCTSLYNQQPYNFTFSNQTTASWNYMPLGWLYAPDNDPYAAALCALISKRSGSYYTSSGEGYTNPNNIASTLESFSLSGATMQDFYSSTIMNEIQNDCPVLCSGQDNYYAHCYLIEGYRRLYVTETEIVRDMAGNILSQQVNVIVNDFMWYVNTGDPGHTSVAEGSYYTTYRKMYVGWS